MKKMTKTLTVALLVLALLAGALAMTAAAAEGYSGTPVTPQIITSENYAQFGLSDANWEQYNGYYAISTAEELYGWASTKGNAVLINDIVVNTGDMVAAGDAGTPPAYTWTPVENFSGTFDGRGHCISGLYVSAAYSGFINTLLSDSTIKNLTIENAYIYGSNQAGGIVRSAKTGAVIEKCVIGATVKVVASSNLGGIAYIANGANLTNCVVLGKVYCNNTNARYVGAILGNRGDPINVTCSGCYYIGGNTTSASGKVFSALGYNQNSNDYSGQAEALASTSASHTCKAMDHPATAASCYAKGSFAYSDCMICGKVLSGMKAVTDYSHSNFTYTAHATDTEKHVATCTDCGQIFEQAHSIDSDYTCVCTAQAAASVTTTGAVTTYYWGFYEAAAYAASQDNSTMVLLSDVDLGEGASLFDGIRDKKNVTLDLNGKTIQSYNSYTIYWQIYGYEEEHVTLTINDSVGTGKVVNGKFSAVEASSNLVINGGTYEAGLGYNSQAFAVSIDSNALSFGDTLTINGGSFNSNNGLYVGPLAYCVINNGTFEAVKTVIHSGKAGQLVIKGGNFPGGITCAGYNDPLAQLLAPDCYVRNAEGKIVSTENVTNIKGSVTVSRGADLQEAVVTVDGASVTYNGSEQKPAVTVTVGGKTVDPAHYTVSYANNTNVGEATVTVTAKGDVYTGAKTVNFEIKAVDLATAEITLAYTQNTHIPFGGYAFEPGVTVKVGGVEMPAADFTVTYANNTDVGTATVTVTGNGNLVGTATLSFEILPRDLNDLINIYIAQLDTSYNGQIWTPELIFSLDSRDFMTFDMVKDVDYTLTWDGEIVNAGDYTLTVTGLGRYTGTRTITFTVTPKVLVDENVTADFLEAYYTGERQAPTFTVTDGEKVLQEGVDYRISWNTSDYNNELIVAKNYSYMVHGLGNYGGTVSGTYLIRRTTPEVTLTSPSPSIMPGMTIRMNAEAKNPYNENAVVNVGYTIKYRIGENGAETTVRGLEFTLPADATIGETVYVTVISEERSSTYTEATSNTVELTIGQVDYTASIKALEEQIAQLKATHGADVTALETELAALQAAVAALDDTFATDQELADAIAAVNTTISALTQRVADLENTYVTKTALENAVEALEKTIADGDAADAQALEDAVDALEKAIADAVAALEKADTDNRAALETVIGEAKAALQTAIDELEKRVAQNEDDIAQLQADLKQAIEDLNKAIADGDAADARALEEAVAALEQKLANAIASLEELDQNNRTALEALISDAQAALEAAIAELENRISQNETDIDALRAELAAKYAELKDLIESNDSDISKINDTLQSIHSLLDTLATKTDVEAEVAVLTALIDELAARVAANEGNINANINAISALRNTLSSLETRVAAQDEALAQSISALSAALTDLEIRVAANEQAITALQNALKQAVEELNAAIAAGDTANAEALAQAVDTLEKAIADAVAALEQADADNRAALEAMIAQAQTALQNAIDQLTKDLEEAEKELSDAISSGDAALDEKITKLNAALNNAIAAYQAADSALRNELIAKINSVSSSLRSAINQVASDLSKAEKELSNAIAAGDASLDEKIAALSAALEDAIAACQAADGAMKEELTAKIDQADAALQAAIDKVNADLTAARQALQDAIAAGDADLSQKIEALSAALENAVAAMNAADKMLQTKLDQAVGTLENAITSGDETLRGEMSQAVEALEKAIAQVQKNLDNAKAELKANDDQLTAEMKRMNTVIIVVAVAAGLGLCGSGALLVLMFLDKCRKTI